MAVAHDAVTGGGEFSGTSPHTVNHTPVGTPKGVLVFVTQGGTSAGNDTITGVTYGGVAMTRVATNGWAKDTSGEAGGTFAYFLGASVPSGAQDAVVSTNGGAAVKWVNVITLTGAANLEVLVSGKVEEDAANPSIALDSGSTTALRYVAIYTGASAPSLLAPLSNHSTVANHDFGNFSSRVDRQTTPGSGSFTVGYSSANDDVAMIGVAVAEVAGGGSDTPTMGVAVASGVSPAVRADASAGQAPASGVTPGVSASASQGVATASGIAPTVRADASAGAATAAGVGPTVNATATAGTATASGVTPTTTSTETPTPSAATATGVSPSSLVTLTPTPGVATTLGISPTDGTLDTTPVPGVATGSGVSPTVSTTTGAGAATGGGVEPLPSAVAGIGSATGQGINPSVVTVVSMVVITATGMDAAAAASLSMGVAVGVGIEPGEDTPTVIDGVVTAYSAAGSRVRAADPGTIQAASGGSV